MPPDGYRTPSSGVGSVGSPGFDFLTTESPQREGSVFRSNIGEIRREERGDGVAAGCPEGSIRSYPEQTCQDEPADVDQIWDRWWIGSGTCHAATSISCKEPTFSRLSLRHGVCEAAVERHVKHLRSCLLHSIGKGETGWTLLAPFKRTETPTWVRVTPRLEDYFALVDSLGQGECGVIRLCEELETGHKFACKTICKGRLTTEESIHEVCAEILTMLQLRSTKSKHLLNIHEVFDEEGAIHLIMDYCDGGDLLEYINTQGTLTEEQAAHILKQAVKGVMAMHSKGIVHRDLKPENILLAKSESGLPRVKVADFGFSVELQGAMKAEGTAGSLHYMAPEVAASRCYGRKVDVWSLGVVLYVCLSGKLPFQGKSEEAVRKAICKAKPCLRQKPWNIVSQEAKALLLWMLHPKREERMPLAEVLSHPWFQMYAQDSN